MPIEVEDKIYKETPDGAFSETDHMIGYSMCDIQGIGNILQTVYIRNGKALCTKRVRMFVDKKVFDSADKRLFQTIASKVPVTPEAWWDACVGSFDKLVAEMPRMPGVEIEHEHHFVNGTAHEFMEHLTQRPWAHVDVKRSAEATEAAQRSKQTRN